jgi:hypothetical protein
LVLVVDAEIWHVGSPRTTVVDIAKPQDTRAG